MPQRHIALLTEKISPAAKAWFSERAEVVEAISGSPAFLNAAPTAQALVVRTYTEVDQRLLSGLPQLRVVGRAGVGLDNINVAACAERGVRVVHTPDANTQAVVEYLLALVSDTTRPRVELRRPVDAGEWNALRETIVAERQLSDMRIGILGLGRIGTRVAQVMGALGCAVQYCDLREIPATSRHGARPCTVDELFRSSDLLTIHIDGRESNRQFVNARLLQLLPDGALLVNTSRGQVLDAAALASTLRARPTVRAVLDVHNPEPFGADYPLLGLENARLLPHLASRSRAAMDAMSWVVRDVWAVLEGREPQWPAQPLI